MQISKIKNLSYSDWESTYLFNTGLQCIFVYSLWHLPFCDYNLYIEELAKDFPTVSFFEMNFETTSTLCYELKIKKYPTAVFYRNGKRVATCPKCFKEDMYKILGELTRSEI